MNLTTLILLSVVVILLQVGIFWMGRRLRKREKENSVVLKYNIDSRKRAWQLMQDETLPEQDREEIRKLYNSED
ncbi:MAG: hypothetical protein AAGA85_07580 [Bacteroidota bacterium]